MSRPPKKRHISAVPSFVQFGPRSDKSLAQKVSLSYDEYETIRLIDLKDMTQSECARQMQISRTTVQSIYGAARKKLAQALVEGRELLIEGGDCFVCENETAEDGSTVLVCHMETKQTPKGE